MFERCSLLKNVNTVSKIENICQISNTFWLYQHEVKYAQFQCYSYLKLQNVSILYKTFSQTHFGFTNMGSNYQFQFYSNFSLTFSNLIFNWYTLNENWTRLFQFPDNKSTQFSTQLDVTQVSSSTRSYTQFMVKTRDY